MKVFNLIGKNAHVAIAYDNFIRAIAILNKIKLGVKSFTGCSESPDPTFVVLA